MNKKVLTLMAGVALFGASTAFAGSPVSSLVEGANKGLYQLKTSDNKFLAVNTKGVLTVVAKDDLTADNVASTLWCTNVIVENQGKAPIYDFVNKGAEALLSVTMDDFAKNATETTKNSIVGGEIAGWAFSTTYANKLEAKKPLYSYFTNDSVVGLVVEPNGDVRLKKTLASNVSKVGYATFTLVEADAVTLNANQINTKLGIQAADAGVQLTFNPDRNNTSLENPFSDVPFIAKAVSGEDFVYIKKADGQYLHVDTAYTNANSEKFLAFNYKKSLSSDLKDQGKFLFTYFPTQDSLVIQVKQAARLSTTNKTWSDALTNAIDIIANSDEKNYVTVQDLVAADGTRIVTIADTKETDIALGFTGCVEAETDKVSLADGLYLIQNATTGKYLASPIHVDGNASEWVSVDAAEQNVMHMPAYQWVVLKTKTSDYFLSTSPVKVVNREYTSLKNPYVKSDALASSNSAWQLTQAAGSKLYYCAKLSSDSLAITQITDEKILGDQYLGYKYLSDDELMITNYAFNYFNPYTMDKYIAQVEGDSTLNALQEDPTYFELVAQNGNKAVAYGYTVTDDVKARIKGMAQLVRATYQIKSGDNFIAVGKENNYVLSDVLTPATFYFKENNETEDKGCFYAFIDETMNDKHFVNKLGVADQSLKALLQEQVIEEVRTSVFAIGLADQPLYRRFNSVALDGAVEGSEDAAKVLKFKEFYRGEYLMDEANENFKNEGVNYLGIDRADKAVAGLSFNVDTAVLNLSARGTIKPQYFVYVSKEVVDAVPGIACTENEHHVDANGKPTDAEHCAHATPAKPGFTVAKYLVSFADSTDADLYKFGEYTRVGFVKGLHIGDSLYFLTNGFEKMAAAELDTATILANYKATKSEKNIIDLKALRKDDAHHNYTWSFRYINPEAAATEEESARSFLFESAALSPITPAKAAWLKSQNGCLVLSDPATSTFENAKTGGDNALIFNIEVGSKDDMATSNETIAAGNVVVAGVNGAVVVKGAEGKSVIVSTILGKVVANEVLTSDNAQITAPAGVVVVSVDGESFKVVVK